MSWCKIIWFLLFVVVLSGCGSRDVEPSSKTGGVATNTPATPPAPNPAFAKLKGRWERPDGGYVLEVVQVDAAGVVEAGYFNPNPIRVAGARAYVEKGETKLFVELRDVNYPGCTYKLTYDPKTDQLFGQYFQAMQQETYDVTFGRLQQEQPGK